MVGRLHALVRLLFQLRRPPGDQFCAPAPFEGLWVRHRAAWFGGVRLCLGLCCRSSGGGAGRRPDGAKAFDPGGMRRLELFHLRDCIVRETFLARGRAGVDRTGRDVLFPGRYGVDQRLSRSRNALARDVLASVRRLCRHHSRELDRSGVGRTSGLALSIFSVWAVGSGPGASSVSNVARAEQGPRDYRTTGRRDDGTTGLQDYRTTGLRGHGPKFQAG